MSTHTNCLGGFVLIGAVTFAAHAAEPVIDPPVAGKAIVKVELGSSIEAAITEIELQLPGVKFTVSDDALSARRLYLLSYAPAVPIAPVEAVLDLIKNDPTNETAEWGEILYEGRDPEGRTGSLWFHSVSGVDFFADQYASTMLGLPSAHPRVTGQGVVVAVLDTGIDATHPLFAGLIAPGGYNFVTGNSDTSDVGDGVDNDGDGATDESVGHGTYAAGLIHLVAPAAKLLPVVVLDSDGAGEAWTFVKGMFHAIDRGVEVMNLSLGSTYNSDAIGDALEEARTHGIVVVAAGGNQNAGENFEEFPASRQKAFGVAAVDDADVKASFSNYHGDFLISAPGTSTEQKAGPDGFDPTRTIYSVVPGGDYAIWEGTSMSTAFVSGAAALIRAQHPEWLAGEETHTMLEAALATTAVDISGQNPGFEDLLGAGRLDVAAATMLAPPAPTLGDLNNDGIVGINDFLIVIGSWGLVHSSADLDGDGSVGVGDFLIVLGNWG